MYIKQKEKYEKIIENRPDFVDAVMFNYQFCQRVMNFEMEAIQAQNYMKKIQEKQKLLKLNQYDRQKDDLAIVIVQDTTTKRN